MVLRFTKFESRCSNISFRSVDFTASLVGSPTHWVVGHEHALSFRITAQDTARGEFLIETKFKAEANLNRLSLPDGSCCVALRKTLHSLGGSKG